MSEEERKQVLLSRKKQKVAHHAPPGSILQPGYYIVTAANYEHREIMRHRERRCIFCQELIDHLSPVCKRIDAWVILENHYHILVEIAEEMNLRPYMGKLHGRTSRKWNLEDKSPGRKVWYHSVERRIESASHYYRSLNYIHHNPVKHGYCDSWLDWDPSSAARFIKEEGRERAIEVWQAYPISEYGESFEGINLET
jgi:putative transposase